MTRESSSSVQSVERAFTILKVLAESAGPCSLSTIARATDLPAPTVHRLLTALVNTGYVTQDPATSHYGLGSLLVLIGQKAIRNNNLIRVARPWLESIADATGETVNLTVRVADSVMQLDHVESRNMLRVTYPPGERFPLHASASGKLFLAHMLPSERERFLASALEPYTPDTLVRRQELESEIATIRRRGYSLDDTEREMGVRCVAAPIVDSRGDVSAAVSISGPTLRIASARLHELARDLIETARAISLAWTSASAQVAQSSAPQTTQPAPHGNGG